MSGVPAAVQGQRVRAAGRAAVEGSEPLAPGAEATAATAPSSAQTKKEIVSRVRPLPGGRARTFLMREGGALPGKPSRAAVRAQARGR